jgi:hypothetical protein
MTGCGNGRSSASEATPFPPRARRFVAELAFDTFMMRMRTRT